MMKQIFFWHCVAGITSDIEDGFKDSLVQHWYFEGTRKQVEEGVYLLLGYGPKDLVSQSPVKLEIRESKNGFTVYSKLVGEIKSYEQTLDNEDEWEGVDQEHYYECKIITRLPKDLHKNTLRDLKCDLEESGEVLGPPPHEPTENYDLTKEIFRHDDRDFQT